MRNTHHRQEKLVIYIITFIFALHLTPALYINSAFLEQFMESKHIGYVYAISSVLLIFSTFGMRPLLERFSNRKIFPIVLIANLFSLLILAFAKDPMVLIFTFIISFTIQAIAFFNLDILLESISSDKETGSIRGVFLTSMNTAFIIGPLITSLIMTDHDFWKVFLLGAVLLIPVIYIFIKYSKNFKEPKYRKPEIIKTAFHIWSDKDLHGIFVCGFLLRLFFCWMIIYTPIFLSDHIGFSISSTALIIAIALIPFLLLEFTLGKLADEKYGEKEILTIGLIITSLSTALMSFVMEPSIVIWAAILFTTRIGASMIEIMTETYLFKKVDSLDIDVIGFFRVVRPVAYIFGTLLASFLLIFIEMRLIFIILAVIMLYGIRYSLSIKDTK